MTEPTERSMPPVEMTSAMPIATIAIGAACCRSVLTRVWKVRK
jgi:hypothetical protein